MRSSRTWTSILLAVLLALLTTAAGAEIFRVTLTDGQTLDTAYQPQESGWDPGMVLLLSDVGNWIGLKKADIQKVDTVSETGAFGIRISKNTFTLGISPNDLAVAEAQAAAGKGNEAQLAMLQGLLQQQQQQAAQRQAQEGYSIKQFVEPGQTQGLPSRFIGMATTPTAVPVH